MWDDKGPGSLYAQMEAQKEKARQEHEAWKAQAWANCFRQIDNPPFKPTTPTYDWFGSDTAGKETSKKSGWFW